MSSNTTRYNAGNIDESVEGEKLVEAMDEALSVENMENPDLKENE